MTPNALFDAALQLAGTGWRVSGTEFQGEPKELELKLEQDGRKVICPECQRRCTIYDRVEKRWRHLNFFQYRCELVAQVPRADCPRHGAKLTSVPWAATGSGFTLLFEALVMLLAGEIGVSQQILTAGLDRQQDATLNYAAQHPPRISRCILPRHGTGQPAGTDLSR